MAVTDAAALIDPSAQLGTRFTGPILSGPTDQSVPGVARMEKRLRFTSANGNFSVPIPMPPGSILLGVQTFMEQAFNGTTPTVKLEATTGGTAITGAIDLTAATGTLVTTALTGALPANGIFYITAALGGATAGKASMMISYSVPGTVG